VSGERDCPRAWSETMLAGGLLGVGGLTVFAGIAWLLFSYEQEDKRVTRVAIVIGYSIAAIIGVHVPESAFDYLRDIYGPDRKPPTWLTAFVWLSLVVTLLAVLAGAVYRRFVRQNTLRSAVRAGYVTCVYGIIGAILSGYVAGRSLDTWKPAPTSVVALVVVFSVLLPLVALIFVLVAMPVPPASADPDTAQSGDDKAGQASLEASAGRDIRSTSMP
jgi:putative Mn2+ efflux pump MntP